MLPVLGFIGGIGPTELIIVLVLVLILFGAGRLPQVFEQFGRGIKAFREAQKEEPIDVTRTPKELAEHDEAEEIEKKKQKQTVG